MIFEDLERFHVAAGRDTPLLGLDLGTKTIGIAVSDTRRVVATPFTTLRRTRARQDASQILQIAEQRGAAGLILGLPMNMNGTEGPRCQSTRAFGRSLAEVTELPIGLWDERLSSVAAEKSMLEGGLSRRKRAKRINHVAASIILQGALDRMTTADALK